ncbi:MAG: histidine kinase dimerization/phospho-acceptor domain-containing protein [Oceanicoccus sp.]|uniref:sensor histidine kinase n=1 Tax=Oceanicoccus sp. TaxID=2691044 RepID=UPI00260A0305|nr:ATP-binding protein [Oceanicoccus sp.]MDG1773474.1 histidine kinase dimerization/phospho-acceptor domain-containing protein [Oceanicoccus sp.]
MSSAIQESQLNQQQNLALLKVYTVYRALLCMALLGAFLLASTSPLVGTIKPDQFFYTTLVYLLLNLIGLTIVLPKKNPFNQQQLFANFIVDIGFIIAIADASAGVTSGLGILLVVVIAASSMMLPGQLAILCAAIASIAIIADTARLINENYLNISSFLPAGILGMTFFITSYLIRNLATRIRGAQMIAEQKTADVNKLQLLNQNIVQRMRTGILVATPAGQIELANAAAGELLSNSDIEKLAASPGTYYNLPPQVMEQFKLWQANPQHQCPVFSIEETGPELQLSFSALTQDDSSNTLVFLENNRRMAQRAQQMKLASLGRLTASIAHEIRNPLGAISHAAQLLEESSELNPTDQRLSGIIQRHSKRMNNVIENTLQLSSRSAPKPEHIILELWLQQFIDEFENTGEATPYITLTSVQSCMVDIDCSQLSQVITNLAQNGLRYSLQQTGKATLELYVHINPLTQLPVLDIIDDGPGVNDDARDNLFEPFFTTEAKGSGLGLYISRELCEANEARLDYIRTEAGKSCFRISFPHPDRRLSQE